MSEHFIEICKKCEEIISQCRCPSKDKIKRYSLCETCKKEEKFSEEKSCRNCKHALKPNNYCQHCWRRDEHLEQFDNWEKT